MPSLRSVWGSPKAARCTNVHRHMFARLHIHTWAVIHTLQAAEADTFFEECAGRTYQVVDSLVARMMLELESAGERAVACVGV